MEKNVSENDMSDSKTRGLKSYAQKKKVQTLQKVDEAIKSLIKEKARINFNSVSIKSNVTKAYLYKNKDIRERIEMLRMQQEGLPSTKQIKKEMTESSKDVLIAAKNKRIKELTEENNRLKNELAKYKGSIYDKY